MGIKWPRICRKNKIRKMRPRYFESQKPEDSELKNLTSEERHRDSKLISLMEREMATGRSRFKAKALSEELNCTLEQLLGAFDTLFHPGYAAAVGPTPPKHPYSPGQ